LELLVFYEIFDLFSSSWMLKDIIVFFNKYLNLLVLMHLFQCLEYFVETICFKEEYFHSLIGAGDRMLGNRIFEIFRDVQRVW